MLMQSWMLFLCLDIIVGQVYVYRFVSVICECWLHVFSALSSYNSQPSNCSLDPSIYYYVMLSPLLVNCRLRYTEWFLFLHLPSLCTLATLGLMYLFITSRRCNQYA